MIQEVARRVNPRDLLPRFVREPLERKSQLQRLRTRVSQHIATIDNIEPSWENEKAKGFRYRLKSSLALANYIPAFAPAYTDGFPHIEAVRAEFKKGEDPHVDFEVVLRNPSHPQRLSVSLTWNKQTHSTDCRANYWTPGAFPMVSTVGITDERVRLQAIEQISRIIFLLHGREIRKKERALAFLERMGIDPSIQITDDEERLFRILLSRINTPVSGVDLQKYLYSSGYRSEGDVKKIVRNFRRKIEPDPKNPNIIKSVRGKGYVLHVPPVK